MISSATGECNFWSLKKFTSAYLLQIAREKSCDYLLIIHLKKLSLRPYIAYCGMEKALPSMFRNLEKIAGDCHKSSEILGSDLVVFGNLRKHSGDLRKFSELLG